MIKKENKSFIKELIDYLGGPIKKGKEKTWSQTFDEVKGYFSLSKDEGENLDTHLEFYETNYHKRLDVLCGIERPKKYSEKTKEHKKQVFSKSFAKGFDVYGNGEKNGGFPGYGL